MLAIKSSEDKEDSYKAMYAISEHLDIMKEYLLHEAQISQCVSVRILLVIARAKGFRVWVVDIKLENLRSDNPFISKIFITNPSPEFDSSAQECLELLKLIYGFADSGDQ